MAEGEQRMTLTKKIELALSGWAILFVFESSWSRVTTGKWEIRIGALFSACLVAFVTILALWADWSTTP